jgi:Skp family chaperone for outer membrane proteins
MRLGETAFCAMMIVLAFVGLAAASAADDTAFALFGWALVAFGVASVFVVIHRSTGTPEG